MASAVIFMRDINRAERLQFLLGVANHLLKCLVSGGEVVLLIHDGDTDRRCLEHATPALLARTQRCFGIPPPHDFLLKVRGARGDAPLKLRICLTQRGLSALPLSDLLTKELVCPLELPRARQRQRQRHHLPDRDRGADRKAAP